MAVISDIDPSINEINANEVGNEIIAGSKDNLNFKISLESVHLTDKKSNFEISDCDCSLEKMDDSVVMHIRTGEFDFGIPISEKIKLYYTLTGFSFRNSASQALIRINSNGSDLSSLIKQLQEQSVLDLPPFLGPLVGKGGILKLKTMNRSATKKRKTDDAEERVLKPIEHNRNVTASTQDTNKQDIPKFPPNTNTPVKQVNGSTKTSLPSTVNSNPDKYRGSSSHGLRNLGHTCYMNAVIQMIFCTKLCYCVYKAYKYARSINIESSKELQFLKLLNELIDQRQRGEEMDIKRVRNYLLKAAPQFEPFVQQVLL